MEKGNAGYGEIKTMEITAYDNESQTGTSQYRTKDHTVEKQITGKMRH